MHADSVEFWASPEKHQNIDRKDITLSKVQRFIISDWFSDIYWNEMTDNQILAFLKLIMTLFKVPWCGHEDQWGYTKSEKWS